MQRVVPVNVHTPLFPLTEVNGNSKGIGGPKGGKVAQTYLYSRGLSF